MTAPLRVDPEVWGALPGMRIVVVEARGLDPSRSVEAVRSRWTDAWQAAGGDEPPARPQDHPRIRPWREAWARLEISRKKYPTSIEAMLRRALKARTTGAPPFFVSPIVDLYNSISVDHVVPAGAFDLGSLDAGFDLRLSRSGDSFRALGEDEETPVDPGEIVYAHESTVLTRHLVWRQSEEAAVTDGTTEAVFVSEILPDLGNEAVEAVHRDLVGSLETIFGARTRSWILD